MEKSDGTNPGEESSEGVPTPDHRDEEIRLLKIKVTDLQSEVADEFSRASRNLTALNQANEKLNNSVQKSVAMWVGAVFLMLGVALGWFVKPSQDKDGEVLSRAVEAFDKSNTQAVAKIDRKLDAFLVDFKKAEAILPPDPVPPKEIDFTPIFDRFDRIDGSCGPKAVTRSSFSSKPSTKSAKKPPITTTVATSSVATQHLEWHPRDATATNPKMCIISGGDGKGLPPHCSAFTVQEGKVGETEEEWVLRVSGGGRREHTGNYTHTEKSK